MNGHENLPTDFEIFSTETENFTTDIEILLTRFNYDQNFVGKTQQKWNFLFKIQQKVKIREQDPTDIENCFTRLIQDSTEMKLCSQDSKWPKFSDSRLNFRHWTSHGHPVYVTQTQFFCSLLLNWNHVNEELSTTPRGRRIVYFLKLIILALTIWVSWNFCWTIYTTWTTLHTPLQLFLDLGKAILDDLSDLSTQEHSSERSQPVVLTCLPWIRIVDPSSWRITPHSQQIQAAGWPWYLERLLKTLWFSRSINSRLFHLCLPGDIFWFYPQINC